MLLVASGRDFHIERLYKTPRIKHALSIEDLKEERVPLTTELNFIKENGLSKLASTIDNQFRNDIAHLKFDIKENMIYIRGKPALLTCIIGSTKLMETQNSLLAQLEPLAKTVFKHKVKER